MKKIIALFLIMVMVFSLTACGAEQAGSANPAADSSAAEPQAAETKTEKTVQSEEAPEEAPEETPEVPEETEAPEATVEEVIEDAAWDELESLGNIKTEDGILMVTITMPADFTDEGITQELLDAEAGEEYVSATLNEDGSVTYKLTKQQHKAMLDEFETGLDEALQEMVDDEEYAYTEIKHNADYTEFDVTLSTEEVGFMESIMSIAFYMYGGFYGIFSGHEAENVVVNYYNPGGVLIESVDSASME